MKNLLTVLFSPTITFQRIRNDNGKGWALPLVVLLLVSAVAFWLSLPVMQAFTEQTLQHQLQANGQTLNQETLNVARATAMIVNFFVSMLMIIARMFIGGALLMLVNLFIRGEGKYMSLSVVALYSSVPVVLESLLTGLLSRLTHATSPYDVALNLGQLFSVKTGWGFALASAIDPFQIWMLVLLIFGTATLTSRRKAQVATWIIAIWIIITLISSAGVAMK